MLRKLFARQISGPGWFLGGFLSCSAMVVGIWHAASYLEKMMLGPDIEAITKRTEEITQGYDAYFAQGNAGDHRTGNALLRRAIACYVAPCYNIAAQGLSLDWTVCEASEPPRITVIDNKTYEANNAKLRDMLHRAGIGTCVERVRARHWAQRGTLQQVYTECLGEDAE